MPQVVCMNLQDAQNEIQDHGVFFSRSEDATGRGRSQIIDSNWQVVAQYPDTGSAIGEGDAILFVVKYGEQPNPC
jgi:beta-lactam-binding protein with PASTA domain